MADPTKHDGAPAAPRSDAAGDAPAAAAAPVPPVPEPDTTPVEEILDGAEGEDAPPATDTGGDAPSEGDDALAAALAERDEHRDRYLRKAAEFENFRKRKIAEVAGAESRGVAKVAKELLTALDHFDLALAAAAGADAEVVKGFASIRDEIVAALARVGVERFSPAGEVFDPNEHEAMVAQPAEGAESGTVLEVYQSGYRINGAVLRPARVVVAA